MGTPVFHSLTQFEESRYMFFDLCMEKYIQPAGSRYLDTGSMVSK
eukprot:SAG11_NODE_327_length_10699_cov_4.828272_5_plen_45_part_00